jgi:microcystin degradation protein MlrC
MKFFIGQLATETNTFAPAPTGLGGFERYGIFRGNASTAEPDGAGAFLLFVRRMIEADGNSVVESICAFAQPSGPTVRAVYESLRDELLADLRRASPVDAVQLLLHGAMVAEGYDDCEGDLITKVREIVGPGVPIGIELDLHCHYTPLMQDSADVIIAFKEYPHTDMEDRAQELYVILKSMLEKRVRPTTAFFDCKTVGIFHTTKEPMISFVQRMKSLENKNGVLSVSLGHGFPWGDVPESGAKLWVVTDNDEPLARQLAERLGREFWDIREEACARGLGLDAGLDQVVSEPSGPVVLADVADNAGGGAPSDSTFVLRRILERGIGDAVIGVFWDVNAIAICEEAGVGATLELRLGGKCGIASGEPIDLRVTVRAIVENHFQTSLGGNESLGRSVWVEAANNVHIAIGSLRQQVFATNAFTGLGITLLDKKLIVVKSTQHFHEEFAPIAKRVVYVSTPGAISQDFAELRYRRRSLDYWPRVANPHAYT